MMQLMTFMRTDHPTTVAVAAVVYITSSLLPPLSHAADSQAYQPLASIAAAASDFVRSHHPWQGLTVQIEPPLLDARLRLAACRLPLRVSLPIGGRIAQRSSVIVNCPDSAGWTLQVAVMARAETAVLVARRAIRRHEPLRADDVMVSHRDITMLPYGYLAELPKHDTVQAASSIAQGAVITPDMTQAAPVIRRGDLVALELNEPHLVIALRGVALADAATGEQVLVKNTQSGRTVQGQALANGRVRVH